MRGIENDKPHLILVELLQGFKAISVIKTNLDAIQLDCRMPGKTCAATGIS